MEEGGWQLIVDEFLGTEYNWNVPSTVSESCLLRVTHRPSLDPIVLRGHTGWVNYGIYNSDGTRALTTSDDRTARIWNVESKETITVIGGHSDDVMDAAFSPDEKQVVTGSWDKTALVHDISSGEIKHRLVHPARIDAVAWSHDNSVIATGSEDGKIRLWSVETGELIQSLSGHTNGVMTVEFSEDDLVLLSGSRDFTAKTWSSQTIDEAPHSSSVNAKEYWGNPVHIKQTFVGHTGEVLSARFNSNNQLIITGSKDTTARIWNTSTGETVQVLQGHSSWVWRSSFSPDSKQAVTSSRDRTARIWNVADGTLDQTLIGHQASIGSAVFSPDGCSVLTGSEDNTARIWKLKTEGLSSDISDNTWSIKAPELRVVQPNGGEVLVVNATALLQWEGKWK